MKRIWISLFGAVLALGLGGCAGGDEGGDTVVSGARTPPGLPSLQAVRWQTDGGSALGQAGFSGGDAGNIAVTTNAGAVLRYGKQTLPTPAKNLLATAGTTITYADLVALLTPTISTTVATFTLPADTGFHLPANATLDLSDAGVGVVDDVEIESVQPIRIDGAIITTRTGGLSVSLALNFNGATELGLAVTGSINTSGAPTRDGGDLTLFSLASVVLTGTVDCRGGAASAAMMINGRPGGELQVFAQFGDVLLSAGAFSARGGAAEGAGSGGNGGSCIVQSQGNSPADFHFQILTAGGAAVSGTAGQGGGVNVFWFGTGFSYIYVDASGGSTTGSGAANDAGTITLSTPFSALKGAAVLLANGGSSGSTSGRQGGAIAIVAASFELARIQARSNGGSGDTGGDADVVQFTIAGPPGAQVLDVVFDVLAEGGDGVATGGDGGGIIFFSTNATSARFVNIQASTAGGDGAVAGPGSLADNILFDFGTLRDATLVANTSGGNGAAAADAGTSILSVVTGVNISLTVTANGGSGADSGNGGNCQLSFGSITGFTHNVTANGGTGTTVDGGDAGIVSFNSFVGTPLLEGNLTYTLQGGSATTGLAGDGGDVFFNLNGGRFVGSANLLGNGGTTSAGTGDGGNGGSCNLFFGTYEGSIVAQFSGGNSVGGDGGNASIVFFNLNTTNSSTLRFTRFDITARGGNSDTANGGNGAFFGWNGGHDVDLTGTLQLSGGQGSVVSGNGIGGNGGNLTVSISPARLTLNLNLTNSGGNGRGNGNGGAGGGLNFSSGEARLRGTFESGGGSVLGTGTGDGGNAGDFFLSVQFFVSFAGTHNAVGGSALGGDAGGNGGDLIIQCGLGAITSTATANRSGGAANTGAGGSSGQVVLDCAQGALTVSGLITSLGGDSSSGAGGLCPGLLVPGCTSVNWTATFNGGGGDSATGAGGPAGTINFNVGTGGGTLGGTLQVVGGNAGTSAVGGFTSGFALSVAGGTLTNSGQLIANGGTSASGMGGNSSGFFLSGAGAKVISGSVRVHGGASTSGTGGAAGNVNISGAGAITVSGTIEGFSGAGATGAAGPVFNLGNDSAATLTLTSSARIRANGGAPAGAAGSIALDPTGTGGTSNTNLVEQAGRVLETFNGAGTNTSNVTRD
ncbi:MAG: hypothetical protein KBG84_08710 [Planctomycetes bacterium]|nr:hypothetical protein [Planctomycetota bacterium]